MIRMIKNAKLIINSVEYTGEALLNLGEVGEKASKAGEKASRVFSTKLKFKMVHRKPPIRKRKKRIAKKLCIFNKLRRL